MIHSWQKFVQRSQRAILIGLVAVMAITLVISFSGLQAPPEKDKPAGTYFGISVSRQDFARARAKAEAYCILVHRVHNGYAIESRSENPPQYYSMCLNYQPFYEQFGLPDLSALKPVFLELGMIDENAQMRPGWRQEHLEAVAWEILVLSRDADALGIEVGEKELRAEIPKALWAIRELDREMRRFSAIPDPVTPENYASSLASRFGLPAETAVALFEEAVRDALGVRKVLDVMAESRPLTDREVYEGLGALPEPPARARLFVAEIDPAHFGAAGVRAGPAQAAALYDQKVAQAKRWIDDGAAGAPPDFVIPPRATVDYLGAFYEDYVAQVAEPTDARLRDFYNQNAPRYREPGQETPRPFAEVQDNIRRDWKLREARPFALAALRRARDEVYARIRAGQNPQDRDRLALEIDFAELAGRLGAQGLPLRAGTLPPVTARESDAALFEAVLGKSESGEPKRDLATFAFRKEARPGSLQYPPDHETTERAFWIFRLRQRTEARLYPLADPLARDLEEEAAASSVTTAAQEFMNRAPRGTVQGLDALRRWLAKSGVPHRAWTTGYFPAGDGSLAPVEPRDLARQIQRELGGYAAGTQRTIDFTHPQRGPRSYLVYVIDNVKMAREAVDSWLARRRAENLRDRALLPSILPRDAVPSWAGRQRMRWIRERIEAARIEEAKASRDESP